MRYLPKHLQTLPLALIGVLFCCMPAAMAQTGDHDELAEIRAMVEAMKTDYENRIAELERRVPRTNVAETHATPLVDRRRAWRA